MGWLGPGTNTGHGSGAGCTLGFRVMRTGALGVTTWILVSCAKSGFEFLKSRKNRDLVYRKIPIFICFQNSHFAGAETVERHVVWGNFSPSLLDAAWTGCFEHFVRAWEHKAVTSRALVLNAQEDFHGEFNVVWNFKNIHRIKLYFPGWIKKYEWSLPIHYKIHQHSDFAIIFWFFFTILQEILSTKTLKKTLHEQLMRIYSIPSKRYIKIKYNHPVEERGNKGHLPLPTFVLRFLTLPPNFLCWLGETGMLTPEVPNEVHLASHLLWPLSEGSKRTVTSHGSK